MLRRWIRHEAGVHGGLLWLKERRPHLGTHADCVGLRERIWAATDCLYAPSERNVPWCPPCDRRSDGGFRRASHDRSATASARRSNGSSAATAYSSVELHPALESSPLAEHRTSLSAACEQ